jgi:sugar transferase EpsL
MYLTFWKRALDLSVTATAMPIALLVLAIVACLVRLSMGRPILFRDSRPGLKGAPFTLYKFRTMTNATGADGRLLPARNRVTRLGRVIRRTSLDELPQLFNVLRGDMSLVGPRPLLTEYLGLYDPEQARRHDVRPGITGLAQISGRNAATWEQKFACDVYYVDHVSLALDLHILLQTVVKVLRREGVSADGDVNVARFTGATLRRESSP